jgi:signal transduction histidine kinase
MDPKPGQTTLNDRTSRPVGPILAIDPSGTVTKANLQARRAFDGDQALEGASLGHVLAHVLEGQKTPGLQLVRATTESGSEPILIVLGEQQHLTMPPVLAAGRGERAAEGEGPEEPIADFIAHELRNDIAVILGLSQLMASSYESLNRRDRFAALKGIQAEAEHARLVLDGLLKLAERHSKPAPPCAPVPVHAVLERTIMSHNRRHPGRDFLLTGDSPLFAIANSIWLELAFANLLENAERATPAEMPIEVSLCHEGSRCTILVLDQGQALSADVYPYLWTIHTKGPPPGVTIAGSGIGLSLCKALVEAMGGVVWAGPRLGVGSAFAVSLPLLLDPLASELAA